MQRENEYRDRFRKFDEGQSRKLDWYNQNITQPNQMKNNAIQQAEQDKINREMMAQLQKEQEDRMRRGDALNQNNMTLKQQMEEKERLKRLENQML